MKYSSSHDPFFFFKTLMNDVIKGKKPYNALFNPLIMHLFQNFSELSLQEKQKYQKYCKRKFNNNVESCIIKEICNTQSIANLNNLMMITMNVFCLKKLKRRHGKGCSTTNSILYATILYSFDYILN